MSSKKRRKRKEDEVKKVSNVNKSPFGINPMQLISMLGGNMDMGQIGNMLSSLNMDGLDLNNVNLGGNNQNNNFNPINDFGLGSLQNMMNNLGVNNNPNNNINSTNINMSKDAKKDNRTESKLNIDDKDFFSFEDSDENIRLLESIKNIVDPSKIDFIEKIIEAYENGLIK